MILNSKHLYLRYSCKSLNLKSLNVKIRISFSECSHSITSSVNFQLRTLFALWIVCSSFKMHVSVEKKSSKKIQINYHPVCVDENGLNLPANQADLYWEEEYIRNI